MIEIKDKKDCCGCSACQQICPKGCISMQPDDEGFLYPVVDINACIDCGMCEKVCPELNRNIKTKPLATYAAINPDLHVRMKSSSGGIFSMLAEETIEGGGVVYGAAFDRDWSVRHIKVSSSEELALLRGSKYLQSKLGDTFKDVRTELNSGRRVLFSGTPCQTSGLKKFLRKDYTNLTTVDFVCHGVPSPAVWHSYLKESSKNQITAITDISFRDKKNGWESFELSIESKKGNSKAIYSETFNRNPYMQAFLANLTLRPSCYDCPVKGCSSGSDITLGDFWGIEHVDLSVDDDMGVSLVMVNTSKGNELIQRLGIELKDEEYDLALRYNPSIKKSVNIPPYRPLFMKTFTSSGFSVAYRVIFNPALTSRLYRRIWLLIH